MACYIKEEPDQLVGLFVFNILPRKISLKTAFSRVLVGGADTVQKRTLFQPVSLRSTTFLLTALCITLFT